jgi:sec-independent protein translocase protein TatC
MPRYPNDDLFAESTMSFGEHLEELRTAIAKSVLGLVIGFVIGLCIGEYIVEWIQTPLTQALESHLINSAIDDVKREYQNQGEELTPELEGFLTENKMVFERVYVEAAEVARVEGVLRESQAAKSKTPEKGAPSTTEAGEKPPRQEAASEPATGGESTTAPSSSEQSSAPPNTDPSAEPSPAVMTNLLGGKPLPPKKGFVETRIWRPIRAVVRSLSAQEPFMIYLKAAFVAGMVIASPYIFWQVWTFVAAGLYPHEKRYVHIYLPFSLGLFLAGAALAFFGVFPFILKFLFAFNKAMNIDPDPRISEWMSFVLFMPLGFGIAFQMPLVMLFLNRIGLFSIQVYASKWRIAMLVMFVLSAILTPSPDPISMLMMALPLTGLYFLGMGLCKWMPRNTSPFAEAYEP